MAENKYTFYRKKVAGRFFVNERFVGFEAANVNLATVDQDNPNYLWDDKVVISFNISELGKFLSFFNKDTNEISLFHNSPKGGFKTLKGKRGDYGNIMINLEHTTAEGKKSTVSTVALFPEDVYVVAELFKVGILNLTLFNNNP